MGLPSQGYLSLLFGFGLVPFRKLLLSQARNILSPRRLNTFVQQVYPLQ